MNYLQKTISISFCLSCLITGSLQADTFYWSDYKKTLPSSIIENNGKTDAERTKEQIKKQHDVNVDRRTLEEIKQEQNTKTLAVYASIRQSKDYEGIPTLDYTTFESIATQEQTSSFGISIDARFDLLSIGKKYSNTYAEINVFEDNIWMGFSRRIQSFDRKGLFSDIGGGIFFQMKDTTREQDLYYYGLFRLGYNFDDWSIKAGVDLPSDSFEKGILNTIQPHLSIGWRF